MEPLGWGERGAEELAALGTDREVRFFSGFIFGADPNKIDVVIFCFRGRSAASGKVDGRALPTTIASVLRLFFDRSMGLLNIRIGAGCSLFRFLQGEDS